MYTYYKLIKPGTKQEVGKEGYLIYNMNSSEDIDIDPLDDFELVSDKSGSSYHAFHVSNDGVFFFITQQSKTSIIIKSSNREEAKFDGKLSFAEVYMSYVTGVIREKSDAIDVICFVDENYIGIDFVGFKNSLGNTKKALIYRY